MLGSPSTNSITVSANSDSVIKSCFDGEGGCKERDARPTNKQGTLWAGSTFKGEGRGGDVCLESFFQYRSGVGNKNETGCSSVGSRWTRLNEHAVSGSRKPHHSLGFREPLTHG